MVALKIGDFVRLLRDLRRVPRGLYLERVPSGSICVVIGIRHSGHTYELMGTTPTKPRCVAYLSSDIEGLEQE